MLWDCQYHLFSDDVVIEASPSDINHHPSKGKSGKHLLPWYQEWQHKDGAKQSFLGSYSLQCAILILVSLSDERMRRLCSFYCKLELIARPLEWRQVASQDVEAEE
jgi:hypothetical protein